MEVSGSLNYFFYFYKWFKISSEINSIFSLKKKTGQWKTSVRLSLGKIGFHTWVSGFEYQLLSFWPSLLLIYTPGESNGSRNWVLVTHVEELNWVSRSSIKPVSFSSFCQCLGNKPVDGSSLFSISLLLVSKD